MTCINSEEKVEGNIGFHALLGATARLFMWHQRWQLCNELHGFSMAENLSYFQYFHLINFQLAHRMLWWPKMRPWPCAPGGWNSASVGPWKSRSATMWRYVLRCGVIAFSDCYIASPGQETSWTFSACWCPPRLKRQPWSMLNASSRTSSRRPKPPFMPLRVTWLTMISLMLGGSWHQGCGDTPNARHCCLRVGHETISIRFCQTASLLGTSIPTCLLLSFIVSPFHKAWEAPKVNLTVTLSSLLLYRNRYITQARLRKPTSQHLQANWMSCATTFNRRPRLCLWTNCVSAPLHGAWRRWRIATPIWQPALAPLAATCHHLPMHAGEHKEHNLPGMKSRHMKVPGMKCCDSRRPCG